jgi:hypothetical protein
MVGLDPACTQCYKQRQQRQAKRHTRRPTCLVYQRVYAVPPLLFYRAVADVRLAICMARQVNCLGERTLCDLPAQGHAKTKTFRGAQLHPTAVMAEVHAAAVAPAQPRLL